MGTQLFDLNDTNDDLARELTKDLIERGKLIEAGFALYVMQALKIDLKTVDCWASAQDRGLVAAREAFLAGAEHVYSSIMSTLDDGESVTPEDERRLALIDAEIETIRAELWNKVHTAKGSA